MWRSTVLLAVCLWGSVGAARAQNPVPTIYQPLIPGAVAPGSGGFELAVSGTGFVSGAVVRWNGTALATTFVSSSRLTADVPAADVANAGTASVTVTNPGTAVASNAILFPVATASPTVYFDNAPGSPIFLGGVDETANPVQSMASGDFNNSGKPDLALAVEEDHQPGFVMMFLGKGDGTFTQLTSSSPPPLGQGPAATMVGDFNGDGEMDLALTNYISNTVSILLGKGDGTFTQASGSPISVGQMPAALALGDFNGDGKLDLAVGNASDNTVIILLGNGDGTFTASPGSPVALSGISGPYALAVGDFNGDGKLDIAIGTFDGHSVDILLGHGDGTFTLASGSPIGLGYTEAFALAVGDFNDDGKLDLAVGNGDDDTVTILLGNGDGTFAEVPNCCGASDPGNYHALAMASGDFNGDGKPDLAMTVQNMAGSSPVDYVQVFLGNGDGTFSPTDYSLLVLNDPYAMSVGDFNGDGKIDFATGSSPYQYLTVLLQTPSPSAPPDFSITLETSSSTLTVQPGSTATAAVDVTSLANFTGSVALACSGLPSEATCSVGPTPSMVLPPGATAYFKINIATTAPSLAPGDLGGWPRGAWPALWTFALGILVMLTVVLARRRSSARGRVPTLALAAIAGLLALSASCGGGSARTPTPPPPTGGTPSGNYTITVKGTSESMTHSATFTLDVQ